MSFQFMIHFHSPSRFIKKIGPDHFVASLDVKSSFTNIYFGEVIDIWINELFSEKETIQNLNRNDLRKLFSLAAFDLFLIFVHFS